MPAKTYTVGPGTLQLGDTGDLALDISCQISSATIEWDTDSEDPTNVLCGDTVGGETTYTAKLNATVLQDLTAGGIVDYSWTNKGKEVPFVYKPTNNAQNAQINGVVRIDPVDAGGDVKTRPTSDIEWDCIGEPSLTYPTAGPASFHIGSARTAGNTASTPVPAEG